MPDRPNILGTISGACSLLVVLHGRDKREAAARLLALDGFDPAWRPSIVHDHSDAQIWPGRPGSP